MVKCLEEVQVNHFTLRLKFHIFALLAYQTLLCFSNLILKKYSISLLLMLSPFNSPKLWRKERREKNKFELVINPFSFWNSRLFVFSSYFFQIPKASYNFFNLTTSFVFFPKNKIKSDHLYCCNTQQLSTNE